MAHKTPDFFIHLAKEDDKFLASASGDLLIEPKIDGEDTVDIRTAKGEVFAINRYQTYYTTLPFLKEFPNISMAVRGEMYVKGGRVYDLRHALKSNPEIIRLAVHDLLWYESEDQRNKPLRDRKAILNNIPFTGRIHLMPSYAVTRSKSEILALKDRAIAEGYEGIVVKPLDSKYVQEAWLKIKDKIEYDVLLTAMKLTDKVESTGLAWAFKMEAYMDDKLTYVGDVSSGITNKERVFLKSMAVGIPFKEHGETYVPLRYPVVAEVITVEVLTSYENGTTRVRLRDPRITRIRNDKPPIECVLTV